MNIEDKMITVDNTGKMTSMSMLQFLNQHINKNVGPELKRWEILPERKTFYAIENFEFGGRKLLFRNDGNRDEAERGLYFIMYESYLQGNHADAPNLFKESERADAQALALERVKNP